MICAQVQEWLIDKALVQQEGTTTDGEEQMRRHLASCRDCQVWQAEVLDTAAYWQAQLSAHMKADSIALDNMGTAQTVLAIIASDQAITPSSGDPSLMSSDRVPFSRPRSRFARASLVNYGIAASLTAALFYLGVFQNVVPHVLQVSASVQNHMANSVYTATHFLDKGNVG